MKRASVIAALLAAAAAYGRELPVQRDLVRPMEFGAETVPEDLRAAPDVAMAIQRREEFAREQKGGGKKGILARGDRRASGNAAAYFDEMSGDEEEGRQTAKKDDWLVRSVTGGAFGNSETNKSAVERVLGTDKESPERSRWWLAEEMEQRKNEDAKSAAPEDGEEEAVEVAYSETPDDTPENVPTAVDSMEERDAKRDEIRNAPQQEDTATVLAGVQKNLDELREKLAVNTPGAGTSGTEAAVAGRPETAAAGPSRDWSQPILGDEPMKVTRMPDAAGWDFQDRPSGPSGIGMGYDRPSGGGGGMFGYDRPAVGGFEMPSVASGGGSAVRVDVPSWGSGGGTSRDAGWGAGASGAGSGWAPLQIPSVDVSVGTGSGWERDSRPTRTGTTGSGTMPW